LSPRSAYLAIRPGAASVSHPGFASRLGFAKHGSFDGVSFLLDSDLPNSDPALPNSISNGSGAV
jgi:hypothetical protein